jgi:hypothetical protein
MHNAHNAARVIESTRGSEEMEALHGRLLRIAQAWAARKPFDADEAAEVRREAVLMNHRHYLETIPAYAALAEQAGVGDVDELAPIENELLSTDDIFKSYDPTWLDERRFDRMNDWLGKVYHERVSFDAAGIDGIDGWIEALMAHGVRVIYSSGSSGRFSFVPRDPIAWNRFSVAPSSYIAAMAMQLDMTSGWQRALLGPAMKVLDPLTLARLLHRRTMPDFDGVFLSFRGGHMGTQIVAQEFAKRCGAATFLYDFDLSASTLRLLATGPKTPEDDRTVRAFRDATVGQKEARLTAMVDALKDSSRRGRKVFLAGAPYLFKELLALVKGTIPLAAGSVVMTGGGWKTFSGEKIEQHVLNQMIGDAFGLPLANVIDGYSMAEIHGVVPRCEHGRYHLPPMLETMVVDEEMRPVRGKDVTGSFAFLDPFAVSYPGFIVSGDRVRMVDEQCACGTFGPAFTEIGRAPGREVKGCGGVMASIQA